MRSKILNTFKVQLFWEGHKNLRHPPYRFDIYLVNVKTIRRMAQIFVAFTEKLNFKNRWSKKIHETWFFQCISQWQKTRNQISLFYVVVTNSNCNPLQKTDSTMGCKISKTTFFVCFVSAYCYYFLFSCFSLAVALFNQIVFTELRIISSL